MPVGKTPSFDTNCGCILDGVATRGGYIGGYSQQLESVRL